METFSIEVPIYADVITEFIELGDGIITIMEGYCWNGASGPAIDTRNTMRGSLVHDALYQLMRIGKLGQENKLIADSTLRRILIEDGMSTLRAWYFYKGVRLFGGKASKVQKQKEPEIVEIA